MGCFGSCNCLPCCMDAAELAEIASSVTIVKESETDTVSFVANGCCHTATATDETIYYTCQTLLAAEAYINESVQVTSKMIKSKKYVLDPPGTWVQNEVFCTFNYDEPDPPASAEDYCDDVYTCGTVNRSVELITQLWLAVRWAYGETKVSIYKVNATCEYGGPIQCKYIVECAVEVRAAHGAGYWSSFTKTAAMSAKNTCCEEGIIGYDFSVPAVPVPIANPSCYTEKPAHDPPFNCPADVEFGAEISYWLQRYRVYDAPEDIPSSITFTDADINQCNFQTCLDGIDSLCFYPIDSYIEAVTGGTIRSIGYLVNCQFCFNIGIPCNVCAKFSDGYPCSCEDRETGRTHSESRITDDGDTAIFDTFNIVQNAFMVSTTVCHNLYYKNYAPGRWPQDCAQCNSSPFPEENTPMYPGPPEDEQNDCNWWDCMDCYFVGSDPVVPVYQMKAATVDSYSFTQTFTKSPEPTDEICIPFPTVVVTLNP